MKENRFPMICYICDKPIKLGEEISRDHSIPVWLYKNRSSLFFHHKKKWLHKRQPTKVVHHACNAKKAGFIHIYDEFSLQFYLDLRKAIDKNINRYLK